MLHACVFRNEYQQRQRTRIANRHDFHANSFWHDRHGRDHSGATGHSGDAGGSGTSNSGATGNTIGGALTSARNIIAGNSFDGVGISGAGSSGNLVENNYIGLNSAGTAAIANHNQGVDLDSGAFMRVMMARGKL